MMRRFLVLATAFTVTIGVTMFASVQVISAITRQTHVALQSMQVGGMARRWEVIEPTGGLPASAPVIVVLSGIVASVSLEVGRDRLLPYVKAGDAELVYPVAYRESWNAIGCCGHAAGRQVNDLTFLKALVPKIDPGHQRPVYLVGYSNGGRMAYRLDCTYPGMFDATVIVKADPTSGCEITKPQTILQISSRDDPFVPFKPGEKGLESPSATVQFSRLRAVQRCRGKPAVAKRHLLTYSVWSSCADGTRLGLAVYALGRHGFPVPMHGSPAGSRVIWAFLTNTPLAPLPR